MATAGVARRLLVPALVAVAVVTGGCVAGDDTVAGLDGDPVTDLGRDPGDTTTLPPPSDARAEEAETGDDAPPGAGSADDGSTDQEGDPEVSESLDPLLGLAAEAVADGFDQPVFVTGAPGTDALYVVEREGVIKVVMDGVVAAEPFLDLTDQLLSNSIEQGLLGLAFDPDFEANRRFYAYWTDVNGDSRLGRFLAPSALAADPESLEIVLEVDQPAERHNAGMIQFGPDGRLYLALGDGGDGGGSAQDTSSLLGSILRLDLADDGGYDIPAGNPFGNEIWVYGLRNPWRFSIDPVDELVYIGDVGQDSFEEINVVSLDDAGANFGWFDMEGDRCFRSGCDTDGRTIPVLQYSHDDGCSVTGGSVYRGRAIPEFQGHYFFADWCKGFVRSFRYSGGRVLDQADWTDSLTGVGEVTSFGTDNDGELYTVNWDGELYRIVPVR